MMGLKQLARTVLKRPGAAYGANPVSFASAERLEKAESFIERFREIVSDPLNLLIERVPEAGYVGADNRVVLHNGNRANIRGELAYYEEFSDILIINRGVHEPVEEYCFQQMLTRIDGASPLMIELGAYWAHYSMWFQLRHPGARCVLIEPDAANLRAGQANVSHNGFAGEFIQQGVGPSGFELDRFVDQRGLTRIDVLHSDIQGYEDQLLAQGGKSLAAHVAKYVFISTHSEVLHDEIERGLRGHGYRIEASSGFDLHTTSYDGFIMASSPDVAAVFDAFAPMGRLDIARSSAAERLAAVRAIAKA